MKKSLALLKICLSYLFWPSTIPPGSIVTSRAGVLPLAVLEPPPLCTARPSWSISPPRSSSWPATPPRTSRWRGSPPAICSSPSEVRTWIFWWIELLDSDDIVFSFQETRSWTHWSRPPLPEVESSPTSTSPSSARRARECPPSRALSMALEFKCPIYTSQYNFSTEQQSFIISIFFTFWIKLCQTCWFYICVYISRLFLAP